MYRSSEHPQQIDLSRLRSLTLKLESSESGKTLTDGIAFMKDFQDLSKKEVTLEVHERHLSSISRRFARHADLYKELERTLLRFSRAQLIFILNTFPISRSSLWVQELGKLFPSLQKRGSLSVVSAKGMPYALFVSQVVN